MVQQEQYCKEGINNAKTESYHTFEFKLIQIWNNLSKWDKQYGVKFR